MLICLFIDEINSAGHIFNLGKRPNSFSICGMGVILILLGLAYTKNQEKLKEIL
jgi:hypothetical protein